MRRLERQIDIGAPVAAVFDALADHEGLARFPGVSACKLVREGSPARNGLGAIRRIVALGLPLHEEVVAWDPPHGYDYRIIKGLPVRHLGRVRVTDAGDGRSRLTWQVEMSSRVPLLARAVLFALGRVLDRALPIARAELERGGADRARAA